MRILFLTSSDQAQDGYSVVGSNITRWLRNQHGASVEIASADQKRKIGLRPTTLKSTYVEKYGRLTLIHDALLLAWLHRRKKPDLIHCNVEHFAPVARWLSIWWRRPYTITAHGTYGVALPLRHMIYRKAFKAAASVICVSDFTATKMADSGIQANRRVIKNGVDRAVFHPDPARLKENYITFVGNTKRRKGFPVLMNALERLPDETPGFTVKAIGNFDDLPPRARRPGDKAAVKIEFLKDVTMTELVRLYQGAKLNVLPSRSESDYFEGFGLIHLEANACGTLTVGTRQSGNAEAIRPGNGFLIEQDDADHLAGIIAGVLSTDDRTALTPAHMLDLSDWQDVAAQYHALFASLLSSSTIRTPPP